MSPPFARAIPGPRLQQLSHFSVLTAYLFQLRLDRGAFLVPFGSVECADCLNKLHLV